jgi:hypothetical protein
MSCPCGWRVPRQSVSGASRTGWRTKKPPDPRKASWGAHAPSRGVSGALAGQLAHRVRGGVRGWEHFLACGVTGARGRVCSPRAPLSPGRRPSSPVVPPSPVFQHPSPSSGAGRTGNGLGRGRPSHDQSGGLKHSLTATVTIRLMVHSSHHTPARSQSRLNR